MMSCLHSIKNLTRLTDPSMFWNTFNDHACCGFIVLCCMCTSDPAESLCQSPLCYLMCPCCGVIFSSFWHNVGRLVESEMSNPNHQCSAAKLHFPGGPFWEERWDPKVLLLVFKPDGQRQCLTLRCLINRARVPSHCNVKTFLSQCCMTFSLGYFTTQWALKSRNQMVIECLPARARPRPPIGWSRSRHGARQPLVRPSASSVLRWLLSCTLRAW